MSLQGQSFYKQDDEYHIWEQRREVNHLYTNMENKYSF